MSQKMIFYDILRKNGFDQSTAYFKAKFKFEILDLS